MTARLLVGCVHIIGCLVGSQVYCNAQHLGLVNQIKYSHRFLQCTAIGMLGQGWGPMHVATCQTLHQWVTQIFLLIISLTRPDSKQGPDTMNRPEFWALGTKALECTESRNGWNKKACNTHDEIKRPTTSRKAE